MLALSMSFGGAAAAFADTPACQEAKKNPNWDCRGGTVGEATLRTPAARIKGSSQESRSQPLAKGPRLLATSALLFLPLSTRVRGRRILGSSHTRSSRKFATRRRCPIIAHLVDATSTSRLIP